MCILNDSMHLPKIVSAGKDAECSQNEQQFLCTSYDKIRIESEARLNDANVAGDEHKYYHVFESDSIENQCYISESVGFHWVSTNSNQNRVYAKMVEKQAVIRLPHFNAKGVSLSHCRSMFQHKLNA